MQDHSEDNPLLNVTVQPQFSAIEPQHVAPALETILQDNRAALAGLEARAEQANWDNFAQVMEDLDERLSRMWSPVRHLNSVKDSDALRAVYEACLPKLTEYYAELGQNEALFKGFEAIAASAGYDGLSAAQKKIVRNALRDFRLSGVDLPAADKTRFKALQKDLAQLANRFERNVLDATRHWYLHIEDRSDLAGLPDTAIDQARQMAEQEQLSGWKFSLDVPSYLPFMMYSEQRELRRTLHEAYVTRASDAGPDAGKFDNGPLIERILTLRQEMARLLGFDSYAHLSLETKMADSPEQVAEFLRELAAQSKHQAEREYREVCLFAQQLDGLQSLEPWDLAYYSEKLRQSQYDFSDEDVRPFFPAPKVIAGMFSVVSRLYGLQICELSGVDVWHPDVKVYEVRDASGALRGRFYADLYVRAHKRGGAWMDECISRKRDSNGVQIPVAYLTCNFSVPVGDRPALLSHEEVLTLFHEFGHGLHHMLTLVDHVGVSGINGVPWDAVELPSQFLENWCWEREALDMIGGHYASGEPLPEALLEKMRAAKNFQSAMQMVRQLEFSLFDLRLHHDFQPGGGQAVQELLDEVRDEVAVVKPPSYNRFQNSFGHIFAGGYAAGYYSYKWAEVLSADAFSRFEEEGVFNPQTGQSFLDNILERGGVEEPMDMFVAFRGREPKVDALLRHSGLAGR